LSSPALTEQTYSSLTTAWARRVLDRGRRSGRRYGCRPDREASIPTQGSTNVAPPSGHPAGEAPRWVRNLTPQRSPVEQWVDDAGNWVASPTPLSRAAYDAVGMALGLEGLVVMTAAALVVATRWQLCRIRYSQWDRELGRVLSGGGRGHGSDRAL